MVNIFALRYLYVGARKKNDAYENKPNWFCFFMTSKQHQNSVLIGNSPGCFILDLTQNPFYNISFTAAKIFLVSK